MNYFNLLNRTKNIKTIGNLFQGRCPDFVTNKPYCVNIKLCDEFGFTIYPDRYKFHIDLTKLSSSVNYSITRWIILNYIFPMFGKVEYQYILIYNGKYEFRVTNEYKFINEFADVIHLMQIDLLGQLQYYIVKHLDLNFPGLSNKIKSDPLSYIDYPYVYGETRIFVEYLAKSLL